ncbi:hypothetical protein BGW42_001261 [Actinomortierella wolfii]|nr:hypothetical protein BGW42_001261 [Actinomortierella wolfii]
MDILTSSHPNFPLASLPIAVGLAYAPHVVRFGLTLGASKKWDNVNPRTHVERQKDIIPKETYQMIKRAEAAHNNGLEITGIYMASVLAALYAGVDKKLVNNYTGLFIISRALYNVFYIFGANEIIASARSGSFFVGMYACTRLLWNAASKKL